LSISGRQRAEIFVLEDLVRETCDAHEGQFKRHNVKIDYDFPKKPLRIRAVKGMVVQILENLILIRFTGLIFDPSESGRSSRGSRSQSNPVLPP